MSGQWKPVRLGDLIEIKHGWPFKSEFFSETLTGRPIVIAVGNFQYTGGFRFESTNTKEYTSIYPKEYELVPGDILLVMTCQTAGGEILGIPARIPNDGRKYLHNQRLGKVVIRSPEFVEKSFLYWIFLWPEFNRELVASSSGTKIVHTAPSRIEAFSFELPPLSEQRIIARILGALDEKIELNRQMNRTLEATAQALFDEWVSKNEAFETTHKIQDLSNRKVLLIGDGYRAKRIELSDEGLPFARAGNLNDGFDFQGAELLGQGGIRAAKEKISRDYDSVFTSKGSVGRLAQVLPNTPRFVYAPQLCYWRVLDQSVINPHILYQWMKGREFNEQIDALKGQTDMADYVSLSDQRRMELSLPLSADQVVVGNRLDSLARRLDSNLAENRFLMRLRGCLLPKLLSGEIRVKPIEKAIEAAL